MSSTSSDGDNESRSITSSFLKLLCSDPPKSPSLFLFDSNFQPFSTISTLKSSASPPRSMNADPCEGDSEEMSIIPSLRLDPPKSSSLFLFSSRFLAFSTISRLRSLFASSSSSLLQPNAIDFIRSSSSSRSIFASVLHLLFISIRF
ncbi:hypothetical protein MRB53_002669 [Persea americana]|uniref:Uncharacterized protein n=1 Tax=Persea americana TaxID=3435 RepID=A0ACC2MV57_PERAE|nr:hypothetical protein MRB53_002669 [Persea americana]